MLNYRGDVYFDSNALQDGDGSQDNPYKYLNSSSLSNCSVAHLKNGEYNYNSNELIIRCDLSLVGENPNNTFIKNIEINNNQNYFNITFINITFINPKITSYGILNIDNCIITNGTNSNIITRKFLDYNFNSQVNIINSNFHNLISNNGFFDMQNTTATIFNSNFHDNFANYGGVMLIFDSFMDIFNSNFHDNSALNTGGIIYSDNSILRLFSLNATNNSARNGVIFLDNSNLTLGRSLFDLNNVSECGGVIYSNDSNITLNNSNFNNNYAVVGGGVLYDFGLSCVDIMASNFDSNCAEGYGGVIVGEKYSNINVGNSTFLNNGAFKEGGVVYINESDLNIYNSSFVNSLASFGGAICNLKSKANIKNAEFRDNAAFYDGGAIYNMYSILNLTQTVFDNNGLFLDNSTVNMESSNFTYSTIELSYKSDFNKDNDSICRDIFYSDPSLDRISGAPIYCGNYSDDIVLYDCYDGRDYDLNTSVKNQGSGSNCWAFASLATLESCLLKINQSIFDLSEENMKNVMARFSDYGLDTVTNGGGGYSLAMGYLSGWFGPVLESEDVYCPTNSLSPILDSCMHIQNIYIIPQDNITSIKEAVCKYGSVYYEFLWNLSYLNSTTYNYNGAADNIGKHAVSIIGWDDNFSCDNFKFKPENKGAWIAKNSWGNTQDNGYLYISYENNIKTLNRTRFFTFIFNDSTDYNHIYQYDIVQTGTLFYNGSNSVCFSNNFTSSRNELLSAVSTYFLTENINYTISVKINNIEVHSQEGFMKNKGYYTIPLTNQSLFLNMNDNFEIIFYLYSSNGTVYAPICNDEFITHVLHPDNSSSYGQYGLVNTLNDGVFCIKSFTILNKTKITIIPLNDTVYTKNNFNQIFFQVLDNNCSSVNRGKLILNIDNSNYATDVVDGIAEFNNIVLSHAGFINCNVFYIDDVLYENSNVTWSFINKEFLDVNLTLIDSCYGQVQKISVAMPENREIILQFNNASYLINRTQIIELGMLDIGNYSILIYSVGDYFVDNNVFNFTVLNDRYSLIANNVTKYYGGFERFYASLIDKLNHSVENKFLSIIINGAIYNRITDANGTVSIALNLNSGVYNVTVVFDNIAVVSLVTILHTVNGTNVVKMFRNGTQYFATFRNSTGNYLVNGTIVKFNINGVMYERKISGDNGLARLNINLDYGEYVITAMNPCTGENAANNITVLSLLTENMNLTKYYRNASQYTVKVLGFDGNPVGAGIAVKFNINGVFYERITNESGITKLNINLEPGDYIITAEYNGCMVSNHIKVLPVLTAQDITMRYRDGTQFVATLVDGQGHPYPDQIVNFNINGIFYNRITDSSGQAKLNINLMPGEYIITSMYNSSSISNTIMISA